MDFLANLHLAAVLLRHEDSDMAGQDDEAGGRLLPLPHDHRLLLHLMERGKFEQPHAALLTHPLEGSALPGLAQRLHALLLLLLRDEKAAEPEGVEEDGREAEEAPARDLLLVRGGGREEAGEQDVREVEGEKEVEGHAVNGLDPLTAVRPGDDAEPLQQHAQRLTLRPLLLPPPLRHAEIVPLKLAGQLLHQTEDFDDPVGGGGGGELHVVSP